jgi:hypothetical protein
METQDSGNGALSKALKKADDYLKQFDSWLIGFIGVGFAAAFIYGAAAGSGPGPATPPPAAAASPNPAPAASPAPGVTTAASQTPATAQTPTVNASLSGTQPPASTTLPGSSPIASASPAPTPTAPANSPTTPPSVTSAPTVKPTDTPSAQCGALACTKPFVSGLIGSLLALLIALAALALGAFTGFLFGLPRTLTGDQDHEAPIAAPASAGAQQLAATSTSPPPGRTRIGSGVNTNLERVSNWLTTIIVGVGLTKLEELPGNFIAFGKIVEPYFGFGGGAFAIAALIYFFICGFFLIYVGTRVKLSLVFVLSQRDNEDAGTIAVQAATALSAAVPPIASPGDIAKAAVVATPGQLSEQDATAALDQADSALLKLSLSDLKTPDQIIAWSNAKARRGDYTAALTGYDDVRKQVQLTAEQTAYYASLLAATGNKSRGEGVLNLLQESTTLSATAVSDARANLDVANTAALRGRLEEGLKRPQEKGYDQSIEAGESLLKIPGQENDSAANLMLARAYGQRLRALLATDAAPPADEPKAARAAREHDIETTKARAVAALLLAVNADPGLKSAASSQYFAGRAEGGSDGDLHALAPSPEVEEVLKDG